MEVYYPFFLAFFLIFLSELGDKTQLLVLSFSSKVRTASILLGVALGSFFSHGIAILFGTALGNLENPFFHHILQFITYLSFLFFGLLTLFSKEKEETNTNRGILGKLPFLRFHYVFVIAFSIAIGELGDKTFLASLGLGIGYPFSKLPLVLGAILGMVASDSLAILFGKFLSHKVSTQKMNLLSGLLFLGFGTFGLITFFMQW